MKKRLFVAFLLLVIALLGAFSYTRRSAITPALSTLETVQKTKTLRCGYWVFEPFISKDPTTGRLSGIAVDYLEETARREGVTIHWTKEVSIDQIVPSLEYHHIDMFCLPCTPLAAWEKVVDFVGSFGKIPLYVYVPSTSAKTLDSLKTARFAVMDGYAQATVTSQLFPQAALISLPNMAAIGDLYDQLKYGKADAVINDHISVLNYTRSNPGVIRRLSDEPVFVSPVFFVVQKGDKLWSSFLNEMTDTARPANRAVFESLIKKYGLTNGALLY